MAHTPLPPQDDDLPAGQFAGPMIHPLAPHVANPAKDAEIRIKNLVSSDEVVQQVLLRKDLTQVIARLGLYDHFKQKLLLAEPVPQRAEFQVGSDYVYLIVVRLQGCNASGVSLMLHRDKLQPAALNVMVAEAADITNKVRIENRRATLAKEKTPIKDYHELNDNFFASDVEFFEAVLMDKFQFRKLLTQNAGVEIEPTAKVGPRPT